jgi:hypothetical protein
MHEIHYAEDKKLSSLRHCLQQKSDLSAKWNLHITIFFSAEISMSRLMVMVGLKSYFRRSEWNKTKDERNLWSVDKDLRLKRASDIFPIHSCFPFPLLSGENLTSSSHRTRLDLLFSDDVTN